MADTIIANPERLKELMVQDQARVVTLIEKYMNQSKADELEAEIALSVPGKIAALKVARKSAKHAGYEDNHLIIEDIDTEITALEADA